MQNRNPDIKKAVVIVPPIEDFYFTYHRFSALGAQIVLNIAKRYFESSELLNFPLLKKNPLSAKIPDALTYLKQSIIENESGSLSYFTKYKHFGPSFDECALIVNNTGADICLVSCFAFCYAGNAVTLAEKIRAHNDKMIIIAGGAGVCSCPEYFISSAAIDYVVTGEAEVTLPDLLEFIAYGKGTCINIPNLIWKENGSVRKSGCKVFSDSFKIEPLISKTFENHSDIFLSTTISRGCPFQCSFCSNHLSQGNRFRVTDENRIAGALDCLPHECFNTEKHVNLNFEDDNVLLDYDHLRRVILKCKEKIPSMSITFENGIDYRLLTKEKCADLIGLGTRQFNFSVATTDQIIADSEKRLTDFERLDELYKIINGYGIHAITYFICGFPGETAVTIVNNLMFLLKKPALSGISLFYAVPGLKTQINDVISDNLKYPCRFAGSSAYPWNGSVSTSTLVTAFRLSRFVNLMKSEKKSGEDEQLINKIFTENKLFTRIKDSKTGLRIIEVPDQDCELVKLFVKSALQA